MEMQPFDYHIAVSFAGENRKIVEEFCELAKTEGIKIFYDNWDTEQATLLGKDLYQYLDNLYQKKAQFYLIFVSEYYKDKAWTKHELKSAQARAFMQNSEYIIPIRLDNTELDGLRVTTGYADLNRIGIPKLVELIVLKLKQAGIDLSGEKEKLVKESYAKYIDENLSKDETNSHTLKRLLLSPLKDFVYEAMLIKILIFTRSHPELKNIFRSINFSIDETLSLSEEVDAKLISLELYFNLPVTQDWEIIEGGAIVPRYKIEPILNKLFKLRIIKIPDGLSDVSWHTRVRGLTFKLQNNGYKETLELLTIGFDNQNLLKKINFGDLDVFNSKNIDFWQAEKLGIQIRKKIWPHDNEYNKYSYEFNSILLRNIIEYLNCWITIFQLIDADILQKDTEYNFMVDETHIDEPLYKSEAYQYFTVPSNQTLTSDQMEIKGILENAFTDVSDLDQTKFDTGEIFTFARIHKYEIGNSMKPTKEELILALIDFAALYDLNSKLKKDAQQYLDIKRRLGSYRDIL